MATNYGFTREEALAELKRRGVDTSQYELPAANAPGDTPFAPLTPGSDGRARITLGLGPSVNAQRNIYAAEGWAPDAKGQRHPVNPYDRDWGATAMDGVDIPIPFTSGAGGGSATFRPLHTLAKIAGGQDYQDYDQATKSFESAFLPVLSGAAVTPTEAQRMIRANLPEQGDTPASLARKATNRAMMINGAADLAGRQRPFPQVGTWDFKGNQPGSQPRAGQRNAAPAPPQPGQVIKGHKFLGGDPSKPESWQRVQ